MVININRFIYKMSRYWRCYTLILFAAFLSFILIFISQNDPQLERFFPYLKLGNKYYYYYFTNNAGEEDTNRLMENNTLEYEYLNSNSRFCLNLNSDDSSSIDEIKIVFLSLGQVQNTRARQAARQTYGKYLNKMNLKMIFFVGNSNYDSNNGGLVKSNSALQQKIDKEIVDYGDIVQINMPDHDNFTSAKALIALRWSMIYCPTASYLYVVSDSAIINHQLLQNILYKSNIFGEPKNPLDPEWSQYKKLNNSVIAGFCNLTDEKMATSLNKVFNKAKYEQQQKVLKDSTSKSKNEKLQNLYKGQYCSGLGWIVSKDAASKLWFTGLRSPYLIRIMSSYLTGYLGYKANMNYLNLFEYEEMVPLESNCLKIFQVESKQLLCAENFTIHNRYANYIATWNTGGSGSLVLSKL
jgi:hypothetical protein